MLSLLPDTMPASAEAWAVACEADPTLTAFVALAFDLRDGRWDRCRADDWLALVDLLLEMGLPVEVYDGGIDATHATAAMPCNCDGCVPEKRVSLMEGVKPPKRAPMLHCMSDVKSAVLKELDALGYTGKRSLKTDELAQILAGPSISGRRQAERPVYGFSRVGRTVDQPRIDGLSDGIQRICHRIRGSC